MSAVKDGARRRAARRGPSVAARLDALDAAAGGARGRVADAAVDRAEDVVRRGRGRLALAGDHTVVALAGATGSGKSSTFNALVGEPVAEVGVRRPTTAVTTAVVYGDQDAAELLAWLEVPRRHQLSADAEPALDGLVLLDLPDHDSTEVAHHLEVDRLVQLVDLLVWVLDPQKYADGVLHERYLRPLSGHRDVMLVVLNHVDEVAPGDRPAMLADVRRLLELDGLRGVPVLAASATDGTGVRELRDLISRRVREKRAVAARLVADVDASARELQALTGGGDPAAVAPSERAELVEALCQAAGVPTVVDAVARATARRGSRHTGWLLTTWVRRLRPDPLRRLHLDSGPEGRQLTGLGRASTPAPTTVQRARVDTAVRDVVARVTGPLNPEWSDAVRRASLSHRDDLDDALDRAVVGTDLGADRVPLWWRLTRALQVGLAVSLLVGLGWLVGLAVLGYLQVPEPTTPESLGLPVPTLLLVAGAGGGVALGFVGRVLNGFVARRRARVARRRLRRAVARVADDLVLGPVEAELAAYADVRAALATAAR